MHFAKVTYDPLKGRCCISKYRDGWFTLGIYLYIDSTTGLLFSVEISQGNQNINCTMCMRVKLIRNG